ncbi:hypothetical protein BDV09DRAFT_181424 [Aspergillus tetrazonus]
MQLVQRQRGHHFLADLLLVQQEQPGQLGLGQAYLHVDKLAEPAHCQLQVFVAQHLLIITPVDVAQACGGILDLLAVRPQPRDPAKEGVHPVQQELLLHFIQGVCQHCCVAVLCQPDCMLGNQYLGNLDHAGQVAGIVVGLPEALAVLVDPQHSKEPDQRTLEQIPLEYIVQQHNQQGQAGIVQLGQEVLLACSCPGCSWALQSLLGRPLQPPVPMKLEWSNVGHLYVSQ